MQQILQLDVLLAVVLDLAQEPGHDVPQMRLLRERLVHVTLGAAAALLPDGAGSGTRKAVRVAGQLAPRGALAVSGLFGRRRLRPTAGLVRVVVGVAGRGSRRRGRCRRCRVARPMK